MAAPTRLPVSSRFSNMVSRPQPQGPQDAFPFHCTSRKWLLHSKGLTHHCRYKRETTTPQFSCFRSSSRSIPAGGDGDSQTRRGQGGEISRFMGLRLGHVERRHLLRGLRGIKMKPPLFDFIFLVVYVSVSVIVCEASAGNTTEESTKEKSSNKADTKMLVCILFGEHLLSTGALVLNLSVLGQFYFSLNN